MGKIVTVTLPDIGEGVVEGEIVDWLKNPNDSLEQDEPVVVVMTDKATVELPSPHPGKLVKQHYKVGEIAIRDKPLYDIEVEAEGIAQKNEIKVKSAPFTVKAPKKHILTGKVLAAPPVRKQAKDLGIDLGQVPATGKEGRVTADDIKHYTSKSLPETPVSHLPGDEVTPVVGIRNLMAKKMAESKRTAPHFSYFEQVEATRLIQLRQTFMKEAIKEGIQVTYMPFFLRALSLTINRYPSINASLDLEDNSLIIHKQQNVGIAIATKMGLIVPVLKNVQEMSIQDIVRSFDELKSKALEGKLQAEDMKNSTITISNFGVLGGGGRWATPILNYPEVAILGVAKIQKQPIIKNGKVVACETLNLSWSFDHRVVDGDMAASCSHYFATLIQNPAPLL